MLRMIATSIVGAMLCALAPLDVRAGTFDVKGVEVIQGESEIALGAAWQRSFPANADPIRQSYELGYGYGLTNWFKAGVKIGFEQLDHEDLEATYSGIEAQAMIAAPSKSRIGLAGSPASILVIRMGSATS